MIHVCSLAALPETVKATGASHILTVMANVNQVQRPPSGLEVNHLKVSMDDIIAAYLEATQLAGFAQTEAKRLFGRDPSLPPAMLRDYLTPWTAAKAEKRFLARF